jgi:Uma2 family endonuclease
MTISVEQDDDILYPADDGKPMAESTEQYRWIVFFKENLEVLLAAYSTVFIAADLLWYPIQVDQGPAPRQAPDIMVIFGRPPKKRRSYKQWNETNIAPQVVFEILSASNKTREGELEMDYKFRFYERYGVEEYYIYDPDEFTLSGWLRQGQQLIPIEEMVDWTSPRLGIRMVWRRGQDLQVYYPDGRSFLTLLELREQADRAQIQATQAQLQASHSRQLADEERQRANEERQRAEAAETALAAERDQLAKLTAELERLRSQLN